MQFSTQLTGAFALFLFSLPAIAVQGGAAAQPHPSAAAPISKEQAKQVTDHLKAYYTLADTELQQCGKAKGIAHCLSRGIDLKGKTTLTPAETAQYTAQYHHILGSELGHCTAKSSFENCKSRIQNANDDKKLNLDKRGKVKDFFSGFVQGFTGVMSAAGQMAESAIPVITDMATIAGKIEG